MGQLPDTYPFDSEQLAELRQHQRRRLRLMPAWLFSAVEQTYSINLPEVRTEGRFIVEESLRRMAEEAEHGVLAGFLDECEAGERALAWENFLSPLWSQNIDAAEALFKEEAEQARERALKHPQVRGVPSELTPILHRYVVALLWAEELASDEYQDPRLTST